MAKRICIDAGHYGKYNRSPVNPDYYESDIVWKLHLMEKEALEGYGFEVILTRSSQEADMRLYDRGYAAKGCMLFMSDHTNACGNESVDYPVVYRAYDNRGNADGFALKLAAAIAETMGTRQEGRTATRRGESGDEYYGVLRGARAAGVDDYFIVEHSFHTNRAATDWLMDDGNLRRLAEAKSRVIAEHYGVSKKSSDTMTKITGQAEATAGQMQAYIKSKNANVAQGVIDMVPMYLSEGGAENIRGDIAFAQSCLETGNFTFSGSAVTLGQNNFCGMGVTENGERGNSFGTPQLGIRAQIQHLKAYANTAKLRQECVDPRFGLVSRGCAAYVEHLGMQENPKGKGWASGAGYGEKILKILAAIKAVGEDGVPEGGKGQEPGSEPSEGGFTPYIIRTACDALNIRSGAGTGYPVVGTIREGAGHKKDYTIVQESGGWGRLKSGAGWISLGYTERADRLSPQQPSVPYTIRTTCGVLNIRSGAGAGYPVVGKIEEPEGRKKEYTIVDEQDGWGRLKSGIGWVSLSYTEKAS